MNSEAEKIERKFFESLRKKVASGSGSYGIVAKLIGILIAVALISLATKLGAYWTGWSPSERQTVDSNRATPNGSHPDA